MLYIRLAGLVPELTGAWRAGTGLRELLLILTGVGTIALLD
jgi:hypothetical protein